MSETNRETMTAINLKLSKLIVEEMSLDHVLQIASIVTDISVKEIIGKSQIGEIVFARHLYFYLADIFVREKGLNKRVSLAMVGAKVKRDHATVLHGVKTMQNLIDTNRAIRNKVDETLVKCQMSVEPASATQIKVIDRRKKYISDEVRRKIDLYASLPHFYEIEPGNFLMVDTGLELEIPRKMKAKVTIAGATIELGEGPLRRLVVPYYNTTNESIFLHNHEEIGCVKFYNEFSTRESNVVLVSFEDQSSE